MVKIIIIGAGISGLSSYLFLRKQLPTSSRDDHDITIYEAYDIKKSNLFASPNSNDVAFSETDLNFTPQSIGSAIGISENGLAVLSRLDEDDKSRANAPRSDIIQAMAVRGHPIERWEISTARGFTLAGLDLAPPKGQTATANSERRPGPMYRCIMITRQACWEILRDKVLSMAPEAVVHKRVVDVSIGNEDTLNTVFFDDGSLEQADLVIGADGLRSILRQAMFRPEPSTSSDNDNSNRNRSKTAAEIDAGRGIQAGASVEQNSTSLLQNLLSYFRAGRKKEEKTKTDFVTPHYEGLVGVGGIVPSSVLQETGHKPGTMGIVVGPNGFFGYGYVTSSPPSLSRPGPWAVWWSTFSSATPYPYSASRSKPQDFYKDKALAAMKARHSSWKNKPVAAIIRYIDSETESEVGPDIPSGATTGADVATSPPSPMTTKALDGSYPTWTTPELPRWTQRGRAVLIGDAAHALQPSSGQGASQALEDSEALALFLRHFYSHSTDIVTVHSSQVSALKAYETLRMPRVHAIYQRSQKMSGMKSDMSFIVEWLMYLAIYVMTWFHDSYNEELFFYDLPMEVNKMIRERDGKVLRG